MIAVGATVHGVSCPIADEDVFKFSAAAGTVLDVQIDTLRRDPPLPAYGCACPVQAYVTLLGSDGTGLAGPWSSDEASPHFRYEVTKADTYFVQVRVELGGIRYAYTLHVRALDVRPPGPGDSIIARATLGDGGALLALGCQHDQPVVVSLPPPGAGNLMVALSTPHDDDGAILFELRGPNVGLLAPMNSSVKVYADTAPDVLHIAVIGTISAGPVLTFAVPDVGAVQSYTAALVDVADRQNGTRDLAGYALTISP